MRNIYVLLGLLVTIQILPSVMLGLTVSALTVKDWAACPPFIHHSSIYKNPCFIFTECKVLWRQRIQSFIHHISIIPHDHIWSITSPRVTDLFTSWPGICHFAVVEWLSISFGVWLLLWCGIIVIWQGNIIGKRVNMDYKIQHWLSSQKLPSNSAYD